MEKGHPPFFLPDFVKLIEAKTKLGQENQELIEEKTLLSQEKAKLSQENQELKKKYT